MDKIINVIENTKSFKKRDKAIEYSIFYNMGEICSDDIYKMTITEDGVNKICCTFLDINNKVIYRLYREYENNKELIEVINESFKSAIIFEKCENCNKSVIDLIRKLKTIKDKLDKDKLDKDKLDKDDLKDLVNDIINSLDEEKLCFDCLFEKDKKVKFFDKFYSILYNLRNLHKKIIDRKIEIDKENVNTIIDEIFNKVLMEANRRKDSTDSSEYD